MSELFFSSTFLVVIITTLTFKLFCVTCDSLIPSAHLGNRRNVISKSNESAENNYLRTRIDFTVDPCEDFFQFACGGFTEPEIEEQTTASMSFEILKQIAIKKIAKRDNRALKMSKTMFQTCLKHASNIDDLRNMITQLGGWALFDANWREKDFSLATFYSKSMQIGYIPDSLFKIDVQVHSRTRINSIAIKKTEKSNIALDTVASIDYFHNIFIPKFTEKMGVDPKKMEDEIFQYVMMREHIDTMNEMPSLTKRMSLRNVKRRYGNIPWTEILSAVFKSTQIFDDTILLIECSKCLHSLNDFIRNTTTKSLVTYLMGSFVFDAIRDADDDVMAEWLNHNYDGSKEDYCATKIFSIFRRVMDYEYIKPRHQYYTSLRSKISDFIQKLKTAMEKMMRISTMMDTETRGAAIDKVKEMVFKIAYDDEIDKGQQVLQYYDNLNLNPNSYLLSLFNTKKFMTDELVKTLGKPAKLKYLEATAGNAAYFPFYNTMFISSDFLTDKFYTKENRPEYFNFAGLGNVIGHEMNHGFDDWGNSFDKHGEIKDWWSEEAKKRHFSKIECIQKQYSTFINKETGNNVDGIRTLSENFGDIGGMEVAHEAYHELINNKRLRNRELLLHRSLKDFKNFTLSQMFWISTAAPLCAMPSKEKILYLEAHDVHALQPIRVNGMAMNSKEFAEAWKCNEDTPMNPKTKCTIWK